MYTKVSVLIPTRNRLMRLHKMLKSYNTTTFGASKNSELVFRVDEDDLATRQFLLGRNVVVGPRLKGYASMATFFNEAAAAAEGDILLCGNDDMVFKTTHWAPRIIEAAAKYTDGIFDLGVTTHNETHFPFSCVSRKVVDTLGFIWDPAIHWGDIYLRDVMAYFGRSVMIPYVQIDHDWAGFAPDQTFLESNQNDIYQRDPTYWTGTHQLAVGRAVQKLLEIYKEGAVV